MKEIEQAISILKSFRERDSYMVELPSDIDQLYYSKQETKEKLSDLFSSGNYKPGSINWIDVPKPKGMLRHYVHMQFTDQLYYTWLVIKCFPKIIAVINPGINNEDELLSKYASDPLWMQKYFRNNQSFVEKQIANLRQGDAYMLQSDITNFSPSIDHSILCNELSRAGVDNFHLQLLREALDKWSLINGRGLPQIFWATDILAEFYLKPLDNFMAYNKYQYVRLSDNIEVYCENRNQSRKIFVDLVNFLSRRGMYLNESKTIFSSTAELWNSLFGKRSIVSRTKSIVKKFPYDLSKFYYSIEESLGISSCKKSLLNHPHDTIPYLNHYYNNHLKIDQSLAELLVEDNFEFEFQRYTILRWLYDHPTQITPIVKDALTKLACNQNIPIYNSLCAAMIIAKFGNEAEIEKLKSLTEKINNPALVSELETVFQSSIIAQTH